MSWDTVAPVLGVALLIFWIYCVYRTFAASRGGEKKPNYVVVDPEPAASQGGLVIVARFTDQLTADLHRVHLESEGIVGVVLGNSYSSRRGRYILQVRAEDAERAVEVLSRERRETGE